MLPASKNHLDVLIIGTGITGLSCAYHLKQRGYKKIALLEDPCNQSISSQVPGYAVPGMADHFTRLSHVLGKSAASRIWRFGDESFEALRDFSNAHIARNFAVPKAAASRRLRIATHKAERKELSQAQNDMLSLGFDVGALEQSFVKSWLSAADALVLEENLGSYVVDTKSVLDYLAAGQRIDQAPALSLEKSSFGRLKVKTKLGSYEALMVVVACHLESQRLAPDLPEAILVPYADQWVRLEADLPESMLQMGVGTFITTDFGYYSVFIDSPRSICLLGGRQFRHLAGVGQAHATWNERSFKEACKRLAELFPGITLGNKIAANAIAGCRPCDDMPLIGPLAGMPEVLVAAGFIGQGLSQGFYAGSCLATLIDHGSCARLPRDLYPERFRIGSVL